MALRIVSLGIAFFVIGRGSWAQRTIIQNAIRELKPRPSQPNSYRSGAIFPDVDQIPNCPAGHFAMNSVLNLGDFERFVFVMSALEHYSEHDCALLLGCSVREVREARGRAFSELMDSSGRDVPESEPVMHQTR